MTDYWVLKVIGKATARAVASPQVQADIASGALCVTGGELCEPIDRYDDQEAAMIEAQRCVARHGGTFKVTMSTDDLG
ncbi:MAG TPA: hypothetical protein VF495_22670 [Phenylobacterium sp.]